MKIHSLRNQLLLSAIVISVVIALAYMSAVSWVIRAQYLDQSKAHLQKAYSVIMDDLEVRKGSMLTASRQLAAQQNLGSTLWYLAQYAGSEMDHATLVNTYQQLALQTYDTGHIADVAKIAIYNATGKLVTFALFDAREEQYGFVESDAKTQYQLASLAPGGEKAAPVFQAVARVAGIAPSFDGPLPAREIVRYAVVDGQVSIESDVPITGQAFDPASGKLESGQRGVVVMVKPLGGAFVSQLGRITDTEINVFTAHGLSSGSLMNYRQPDTGGDTGGAGILFNEIEIDGAGYYQGLIPLDADGRLAGYIATLRSKALVRHNTWEMIGILGLIAVASLVLVIPFAWYFATSISRPLTVLSRIFREVARGEKAVRLDDELNQLDREVVGRGEMGDLTQSFTAMNDSINQKIREIHQINASLENTIAERTAALVIKEQESRTLIENSQDTIARYDKDCRRIYANPAFVAMAGRKLEQLLGKRPSEIPGGPNAELYEKRMREVLASGRNDQFELKWSGKDGQELCSHIQLTAERFMSDEVTTVLAVGRDISDRIAFEKTIWKQANFDSLTNLPNRRMFHERLEQHARMLQHSGQPMALMLIDLDHFKEVNDSLGHDMGDCLLIEAAHRITTCLRASDTVARLGGDEFIIILPGVGDVDTIGPVAQNIINRLTEPFVLGANMAYISASIGISLYPNDTTELDALFKNADMAMYAAKSDGRNRYSYFTPNLQETAQKRLHLTNDLRAALVNQQFQVYYQPIVDLNNERIYKAEALIRWLHPEHGMINPVEFIPLAEETGLIVPIGDWVFKQAVRQAMQWRAAHDETFQISVNISPVQIRHSDVELVAWHDYLSQQGVPGSSIAIEITEGVLLNAEPTTNGKLLQFRDAGIQVAIDDFGTGYSSLSYLKRFDIDYLKIDRSFVHNLSEDANNLALCEAIIMMAHKLGLKVIAEGVETTVQRDLLLAANCDYAQGFLYSKPVPPDQFEAMLRARDERVSVF